MSGAGSYSVWITDNTTGQVVLVPAGSGLTSVKVPSTSALTPGQGFTWWIGAVSTNGLETVWNQGRTFTIAPLTAPQNLGTSGPQDQPTFTWGLVNDAGAYEIWLTDNNTSQVKLFTNLSGPSFTLPGNMTLIPGDSYTWWVGAISTNNLLIVWSAGVPIVG